MRWLSLQLYFLQNLLVNIRKVDTHKLAYRPGPVANDPRDIIRTVAQHIGIQLIVSVEDLAYHSNLTSPEHRQKG